MKIKNIILILVFLKEFIILIIKGDIKFKNKLKDIKKENIKLVNLKEKERMKEKLLS